MTVIQGIGMVVILFTAGLLAAAKAALARIQAGYYHSRLDNLEGGETRIIKLLDDYPQTEASLRLSLMVTRFLAAGLLIQILLNTESNPGIWLLILILFGLAVILAMLEWGFSLLVIKDPGSWSRKLWLLVFLVTRIFSPLISILFLFTRDLEELRKNQNLVSEDKLKTLVDESHRNGLLEKDEQKMIHSVFRLDETYTREIMVPRIDIMAIDVEMPLSEAVRQFVDSGYSRIPVYQTKIDNIVGMLYAKDLLEIYENGDYQGGISNLLREAYCVPETKLINELLADMQKKRIHQAIVVDEYGGVAGIVTLEDIIEEIFGDIQDEYDEEETLYITIGPGEYIFQGKIDIDDLNLILNSSLPNDEADTLGGLVYCRLGHVPNPGEVVQFDDLLIKVEQVEEHRIIKVRVKILSPTAENKEKQ
jgi:CBS domain containing-hemolysin-like protein